MKMHRIVVYVLDYDGYGADDFVTVIKNSVDHSLIGKIDTTEIGPWSDDHPVNKGTDPRKYFLRSGDPE